MPSKKLDRAALEKKRQQLRGECEDYVPTRGGYRCQHYAQGGSCKRDDYFMCVIWAKRNPDKAPREPDPLRRHTQVKGAAEPKGASSAQPRADRGQAQRKQKDADRQRGDAVSGRVFRLANVGVKTDPRGRHLVQSPELLTETAVEQLVKLGIEVQVQTSMGTTVTLVPERTTQDRCELTFRQARTLVMLLQIFPGATLAQISQIDQEQAS